MAVRRLPPRVRYRHLLLRRRARPSLLLLFHLRSWLFPVARWALALPCRHVGVVVEVWRVPPRVRIPFLLLHPRKWLTPAACRVVARLRPVLGWDRFPAGQVYPLGVLAAREVLDPGLVVVVLKRMNVVPLVGEGLVISMLRVLGPLLPPLPPLSLRWWSRGLNVILLCRRRSLLVGSSLNLLKRL